MLEDECGNFIAKDAQILKGVLSWGRYFTFKHIKKVKSAGNIWVSGYVHHRLKRGHPGLIVLIKSILN